MEEETTWEEQVCRGKGKKEKGRDPPAEWESGRLEAWSGAVDGFLVAEDEVIVTSAAAAYHLMKEKRFVGKLVGALPSHKSQNLFHSLPFYLMPEETTYALRMEWMRVWKPVPRAATAAVPLAEPSPMEPPSMEGLEHVQWQCGGWTWPRNEEQWARQAVWEACGRRGMPAGVLHPSGMGTGTGEKPDIEHQLVETTWWISSGQQFGADWLLYAGDPLRHHATCLLSLAGLPNRAAPDVDEAFLPEFGKELFRPEEQCITALELLTYSRLALTVRKAAVLAMLDFAALAALTETGDMEEFQQNRVENISFLTATWLGVD